MKVIAQYIKHDFKQKSPKMYWKSKSHNQFFSEKGYLYTQLAKIDLFPAVQQLFVYNKFQAYGFRDF